MTLITNSGLNRRRFLQTTAATAIAASIPLGAAIAAPKRGGHLRIGKGHGQTTDTMNPGEWSNGFVIGMSFGIHGRLTEIAADGSLVPEVAESWDPSADASEWTFHIRKGMTFHDGKEVTAEDAAASINFHRGEDSTSAAGPLVAAIQDVVVTDSHTLIFKLDGGNADFPVTLSDYHLPILAAKDGSVDWQSGNGCGSYVLKNANMGVSIEMERNPNHWRDNVAWFDSIEILALIDQNARTAALVSGDVHLVDRLDLKTVGLLARNKDINIHSISGNQHYTLPMNSQLAPFDNNHVRQALKYGVNREELIEKILFGYGSVGNDHPIGSGQRFFNSDLEQRTYDPDKAKWHLKEAGLDSLSVELSASDAAFGGAVDAAILVQNSAKSAGIDIKVTREPNDGYWSDVWMKKGWVMSYWSGRVVEDQMFATAYSCGAAWNESNWCNDRFEELLLKARSELDNDKRREMYFEMQDICANNSGAVIPMFANYVFATNKAIGTPEVMGTNWDLDGERWSERWWFA